MVLYQDPNRKLEFNNMLITNWVKTRQELTKPLPNIDERFKNMFKGGISANMKTHTTQNSKYIFTKLDVEGRYSFAIPPNNFLYYAGNYDYLNESNAKIDKNATSKSYIVYANNCNPQL